MNTVVRNPESPLSEFFQWMDLGRPMGLSGLMHYIPVESYTEEGKYVVRADLPGVDPEKDIDITVEGDVLTIHGERRDEEHESGRSEVRYGSFIRSVRLPRGADAHDVTARYEAGVLTVTVPMTEASAQRIKVAVEGTATAGS